MSWLVVDTEHGNFKFSSPVLANELLEAVSDDLRAGDSPFFAIENHIFHKGTILHVEVIPEDGEEFAVPETKVKKDKEDDKCVYLG